MYRACLIFRNMSNQMKNMCLILIISFSLTKLFPLRFVIQLCVIKHILPRHPADVQDTNITNIKRHNRLKNTFILSHIIFISINNRINKAVHCILVLFNMYKIRPDKEDTGDTKSDHLTHQKSSCSRLSSWYKNQIKTAAAGAHNGDLWRRGFPSTKPRPPQMLIY